MDTAIQCIYRDMEYAKVLIEAKADKNKNRPFSENEEAGDEDDEEQWTFIGDGGQDPVSEDEIAESSPSRRLPSESVIWTASAPTGHQGSLLDRSASHRSSSSAGSGDDRTVPKRTGW